MATKSKKLPLPTSDAEVNEYITAVAQAEHASARAVAKANQKIQTIKAALADEVAEIDRAMKPYAAALFTYFEKHRDELTDGGKRESCVFMTGILGQRMTPPRTQIKDEDSVIAYVIKHRLTDFYEEKVVLRRDAMLANRPLAATIPGVSFVRDRIIFIKHEPLEVIVDLKKKVETAP